MDEELWELGTELEAELRREQEAEAASWVGEERRTRTFQDVMRTVAAGDVVAVVTVDGALIRGRVLAVGGDIVTIGETAEVAGTARSRSVRVHDIRVDACIRLVREPGPR